MKTVDLGNTTKADNLDLLAVEIAEVLNTQALDTEDFQAEGIQIIEYDLTEMQDPVYWDIDSICWSEDGTASRVELDC